MKNHKIMWFQWITLIGIIDITFPDVICYQKKVISCKLYNNILESNACMKTHNLTECVLEAARDCKMENDEDVRKRISFLIDMCQEGTEMNIRYKKYSKCLDVTNLPLDCDVKFNKALLVIALKRLSATQFYLEAFKVECSYNETITACNLARIRKQCGPEAESYFRMRMAAQRINIRLCKLINNSYANSVHISVWIIQALLLVLFYFFYK